MYSWKCWPGFSGMVRNARVSRNCRSIGADGIPHALAHFFQACGAERRTDQTQPAFLILRPFGHFAGRGLRSQIAQCFCRREAGHRVVDTCQCPLQGFLLPFRRSRHDGQSQFIREQRLHAHAVRPHRDAILSWLVEPYPVVEILGEYERLSGQRLKAGIRATREIHGAEIEVQGIAPSCSWLYRETLLLWSPASVVIGEIDLVLLRRVAGKRKFQRDFFAYAKCGLPETSPHRQVQVGRLRRGKPRHRQAHECGEKPGPGCCHD